MPTLPLTDNERRTGTLTPDTLEQAKQAVTMDGYVIFERVLPPEQVAFLHTEFWRLLEAHAARTDPNRGANRYQMHLPFQPPFNDASVIANPLVLSILDGLLGKDYRCHYFASDTPLPGSDYQPVHSDISALFPETALSLPAYSVVLNIPLVDFTEENGPLEIWPGGTHFMPGGVDMKRLATQMRSERVLMPAGSFLLRDMRMWHRGTPNRSDHARPNMALVYSRGWLADHYARIPISRAAYDALGERARYLFRHEAIEPVADA